MKQGHFIMLFLVIYIVCFLTLLAEQTQYDRVLKEKQRIESGLCEAIEDTARNFTAVLYDSAEEKKKVIETTFLESMYVALGVFGQKEEQEKIKMCLPMLVLVEEDGAFFYHMQEVESDGITELQHGWSEKIEFDIPEGTIEAKRKAIIAETLETVASELITEHNYIASQYGLEYTFSAPRFLQNTGEELKLPMLVAVFQGWPLDASAGIFYENCVDAGVYIQETERYIVELPDNLFETVSYYHKSSCADIVKEQGNYIQEPLTKQEAIRQYGAFPCENCIP